MAKSKVELIKVDYKDLVREIRKTLKTLKKVEKKVGGKQKSDIAVQVKALNYLEEVCAVARPKMSFCNVAPKMSKCNLATPRMSKIYIKS
jgi:hypothetical protein